MSEQTQEVIRQAAYTRIMRDLADAQQALDRVYDIHTSKLAEVLRVSQDDARRIQAKVQTAENATRDALSHIYATVRSAS
jgi:hypothetical protein